MSEEKLGPVLEKYRHIIGINVEFPWKSLSVTLSPSTIIPMVQVTKIFLAFLNMTQIGFKCIFYVPCMEWTHTCFCWHTEKRLECRTGATCGFGDTQISASSAWMQLFQKYIWYAYSTCVKLFRKYILYALHILTVVLVTPKLVARCGCNWRRRWPWPTDLIAAQDWHWAVLIPPYWHWTPNCLLIV